MTKKNDPSQDVGETTAAILNELRDQMTTELSKAKNSDKIEMLAYDFSMAIDSLFHEKSGEMIAAVTGYFIMSISAHYKCPPLEAAQEALAHWAAFCMDDDPNLKKKVVEQLGANILEKKSNDPETPLN